jgi:quinol monooxygenase YgiN
MVSGMGPAYDGADPTEEGAVMGFIQIIEAQSDRIDEIEQLADEYEQATSGKRTVQRTTVTTDRDRPGTFLVIAEFASYEDAMRNSELPETQQLAEQIAKLCSAPPAFRNLDVRSQRTL